MKPAMIIISILFILFIGFQFYISMATDKTESQPYQVIRAEKAFQIRYYPAAVMAKIASTSKSYRDLGSSGFSKLAQYIFGGNSENKQIAMTSPVHMDIGDSLSTMAFVMPGHYKQEDLPQPNSAEVLLQTVEAEYVAALSFGGFASTAKVEKHKRKLQKLLEAKGIAYYGNFRLLGYNPPYQIINRRNEIIVSVYPDDFEAGDALEMPIE